MQSLLFDCIFLNGLTKKEEKLLFALLDWKEISTLEWTGPGGFPETKNAEVVVRRTIDVASLQTSLDWSKQPLLLGRVEAPLLKELSRSGLNYFLNLETDSLVDLPLENVPQKKDLTAVVVGPYPLLYRRIRARLRLLGWETYPCAEIGTLTERFKEFEPGLLFVDWERLDVKETVEKLRNLPQRAVFPPVIGIRDVKREGLFRDLSAGIRDFCPELYSEKEIYEILNISVFEERSEQPGFENRRRLTFEFRTGPKPTGIRVEKTKPIGFWSGRTESFKLARLLVWMDEFL
ncbi:hypothetical protein [Leptospira ellisii]|uniref:Uncharacterized protein n=1 Tax=Leptospira ellisii TaxID=2023197 RepID=A0A2N0B3Y3_9LEPT|nr:hypothetical protein [Leptospira ellisii]PJZ91267.1 hypothetical protein CH379_19600 [Leptospira ellisii]PKA06241.1 hypothetical protein CH375_00765 [Leptospira ellisii]